MSSPELSVWLWLVVNDRKFPTKIVFFSHTNLPAILLHEPATKRTSQPSPTGLRRARPRQSPLVSHYSHPRCSPPLSLSHDMVVCGRLRARGPLRALRTPGPAAARRRRRSPHAATARRRRPTLVAADAGHPPLPLPARALAVRSVVCSLSLSLSARFYPLKLPAAVPLLCDLEAIPQAKVSLTVDLYSPLVMYSRCSFSLQIFQFLPYQLQLPQTPKVHKTHDMQN